MGVWGRVTGWFGGRNRRTEVRGSAYAGARYTRLMDDWYPALLSADREIKSSLRTLRARSREFFRDNPHASAFENLIKTNVIGPDGVDMQSQIMTLKGDLRKTTNQAIEDGFDEWGDAETASVDGRLCWVDQQELAIGTVAMDGECFIRIRRGYPNRFGFALQFLDADQFDEYFERPPGAGQNEIRMSVEIDGDGRPVAYWPWANHPSEPMRPRQRVRIPAEEIIHLFVTFRPGQTRGIPWLTPVMLRLGLLDGLEEAEIVASRDAAAKPVYFEVTPEGMGIWGEDEFLPKTPLVEDVEPGTSKQIPAGLRAVQMNPTHPTTAFPGFHKSIIRTIASGIRVAYVSLTGDLEGANYGSQRGGLLLERDCWERLQWWLVRQMHQRVFREWLLMAATMEAVPLPTLDVKRWCAPVWEPRGWPWIDPQGDIDAAEREVQLGVNNRRRICARRGINFEENLEELANEQQMAADAGVDISGKLVRRELVTPDATPPADSGSGSTQPNPTQPDPTTDDTAALNGGRPHKNGRKAALDRVLS
jgi:lambda family phage portal protein